MKIAEFCEAALESLLIEDAIWLGDDDAIAKTSENEEKRKKVTETQRDERALGSIQRMIP